MVIDRKLPDWFLKELEANALRTSDDKKNGDRWSMNHGYVLGRSETGAYTICHPCFDNNPKGQYAPLHGYPIHERHAASDFSRHIAGASPSTLIRLIREVRSLRQQLKDRACPPDRQ